jgi:GNAT superfamily N-acetyltransferase
VNLRRPTLDDAEAAAALIRAYDEAYGAADVMTAEDMLHEWTGVDLEHDAWLLEDDGRAVALGCVYGRRAERLDLDGYVHPAFTGRGLGTEILRLGEERVRERGAARIHVATLEADERGRELLESRGYRLVRSFLRMEIELTGPPPEPVVPEGLTLTALTEDDDRAVHAAVEEAVVDHGEHDPRSFESWQERRAGSDRAHWFAVRDGDELAGVSVNDRERFGAGWIGTLATRRPWRGRGVAPALVLASFGEFWRRGERRVQLGVDASSPTGAVRLYERVGMRTVWRADVYEKTLA